MIDKGRKLSVNRDTMQAEICSSHTQAFILHTLEVGGLALPKGGRFGPPPIARAVNKTPLVPTIDRANLRPIDILL